jgi:two-component system invasion response regulator UvrY
MVVDDQSLVRKAISSLINGVSDIKVINEATTGEEAVRLMRSTSPDVILMDIEMPGIGGLEASRKLLRSNPHVKIIIVTAFCTNILAARLLKAGVAGYVTKDSTPEDVANAIRRVAAGERYLGTQIASEMAVANLLLAASPFAELSDRELQILLMLARGVNGRTISKQLYTQKQAIKGQRN